MGIADRNLIFKNELNARRRKRKCSVYECPRYVSTLAVPMMIRSLTNLPFNFKSITWYMNSINNALNREKEFTYKMFKYLYFEAAAS